jgi:hypothetical protein
VVDGRTMINGGDNGFDDVWALSLGPSPQWTTVTPSGSLPDPGKRYGHKLIYDPVYNRMILKGGYNPLAGGYYGDTWMLTWDEPTPALVSLVSARGERGVARVTWQVSGSDGARFSAWRRTNQGGWTAMGDLVPDGEQRVTLEDRSVMDGARYEYRLRILEGTNETFAGEVWVEVPRAATLSLAGARPNPAAGAFAISFVLEDESPARLELFDTAGRRVLARDVGALGAGDHEVRIERLLPSGLYLARLRQNGRALTARVLIGR